VKRRANAGRKPIDVIVMFRMLVLQIALQSGPTNRVEYQVRDPALSFHRRFLAARHRGWHSGRARRFGLFSGDALRRPGLIEETVSSVLAQHLEAKGYIARGGQMVDCHDRAGSQNSVIVATK